MKKSDRDSQMLFRIDPELKRQFKAWCANRGKTIKEVATRMIIDTMKEK